MFRVFGRQRNHVQSTFRLSLSSGRTTDLSLHPLGLFGVPNESFEFITPKLIIGNHIAAAAVADAIISLKLRSPLIVSGSNGLKNLSEDLQKALLGSHLQIPHDPNSSTIHIHTAHNCAQLYVRAEPTVNAVKAGTSAALLKGCDGVIAIGGGSVIDTGKAISAMITNHGDIYDHLDVSTNAKPLTHAPVPFVAIPTVSGSGAEVTSRALLRCAQNDRTLSLQDRSMMPKIAIIDPALMMSCSSQQTSWSGLNALYQVVAPYISDDRNPILDALCMEGIVRIARSLPVLLEDGNNARAREDMAIGSTLSGLVQDNCHLGSVYGIANALGGFGGARSKLCASLFPRVLIKCVEKTEALLERLNNQPSRTPEEELQIKYINRSMDRWVQLAHILTGSPTATVRDMGDYLLEMKKKSKIPNLKELCNLPDNYPLRSVAEKAVYYSGTQGYTVELSVDEIEQLLKAML